MYKLNLTLFTFFFILSFQIHSQEIDPNFLPEILGTATGSSIAVQEDNKILVSGVGLIKVGDQKTRLMARLNPNGSLDTSFTYPDFGQSPLDIGIQKDGKIIIAGSFSDLEGNYVGSVFRLLPNGAIDSTFQPLIINEGAPQVIHILDNQKIFVAGFFIDFDPNGTAAFLMLPDGGIDPNFPVTDFNTEGQFDLILDIDAQSDNQLLIAGGSLPGTGGTQSLIRVDASGKIDPTFVPTELPARVREIDVSEDGSIGLIDESLREFTLLSAAGSFISSLNLINNSSRNLALLSIGKNAFHIFGTNHMFVNGDQPNILASFNPNFSDDNVLSAVRRPDGKFTIIGSFKRIDDEFHAGIVQLDSTATRIDDKYQADLFRRGLVQDILLQEEGKLLVAGDFVLVNGQRINHIARLNADGSLDNNFNTAIANITRSLAKIGQQSDGDLILVGDYQSNINDGFLNGVAKTNKDGFELELLDFPTNNCGSTCSFGLNSLAIDSQDRFYVGSGSSSSRTGQDLVRYDSSGTPEINYNRQFIFPGSGRRFLGLEILPEDRLAIFGSVKDQNDKVSPIAIFDNNGNVDTEFNINFEGRIGRAEVILNTNNSLYFANRTFAFNVDPSDRFLLKLNPQSGQVDTSFNSPNIRRADGGEPFIFALFELPANRILLKGRFEFYNDIPTPEGTVIIDYDGNFIQTFELEEPIFNVVDLTIQSEDSYYMGGIFGNQTLLRIEDIITSTTSLSNGELLKNNFKVYPNPSSLGQIQVEFTNDWIQKRIKFQIIELATGKIVHQDVIQSMDLFMLDIATLNKGTFVIKAMDENGNYSTQIFLKQ